MVRLKLDIPSGNADISDGSKRLYVSAVMSSSFWPELKAKTPIPAAKNKAEAAKCVGMVMSGSDGTCTNAERIAEGPSISKMTRQHGTTASETDLEKAVRVSAASVEHIPRYKHSVFSKANAPAHSVPPNSSMCFFHVE